MDGVRGADGSWASRRLTVRSSASPGRTPASFGGTGAYDRIVPTQTLLFADQVGSTEQLRALGEVTAGKVRRAVMGTLERITLAHQGRTVDLTGDGLFAAFPGAADALDAAAAMQHAVALANRAWPLAAQVGLRIGVHTGEPIEGEAGTLFGLAVVVARRLCDDAPGGTVQVSDLTRSLVAHRGTYAFEARGERSLKGIDEPVAAWVLELGPPLASLTGVSSGADMGRAPSTATPAPTGGATAEATRLVSHPEVFVALADRWHTARSGRGSLVVLAGPREITGTVLDELAAAIATTGVDVSAVIAADPGSRSRAEAAREAVEAALPAGAVHLLELDPGGTRPAAPPDQDPVLAALGTAGGAAALLPADIDPPLSPADLAWLADLGRTPGWLVVVATDDASQLTSSPIAELLTAADAVLRAGPVPSGATEQQRSPGLGTVVLPGLVPPAPGPGGATGGPEAPTTVRDGARRALLRLPTGEVVDLPADGVTVGRGRDVSIRIDDEDVSRRHLRIHAVDGRWLAEDLGSTNGTTVNGMPARTHVLADGDEIVIGNSALRISLT